MIVFNFDGSRSFARSVLLFCCLILSGCNSEYGGNGGGYTVTPKSPYTTKLYISGGADLIAFYANDTDFTRINPNLYFNRFIAGLNTNLHDPRGIAVDLVKDKLYVANFGDNSILVFDNASKIDGIVAPTRKIKGAHTLLANPIFLFLDTVNDRLYVTNFSASGHAVLVFDNVSANTTADDIVPARAITSFTGQPSGIYVDTNLDILYVADFTANAIYVFNSAHTVTGNVAATRTISGNLTTIQSARGLFVDTINNRIYLANNASVLVFNSASTAFGNIVPDRKITIGNSTLSPSDLFLDVANDRLYVLNAINYLEIIDHASIANGGVVTRTAVLYGVTGATGIFVDTRLTY